MNPCRALEQCWVRSQHDIRHDGIFITIATIVASSPPASLPSLSSASASSLTSPEQPLEASSPPEGLGTDTSHLTVPCSPTSTCSGGLENLASITRPFFQKPGQPLARVGLLVTLQNGETQINTVIRQQQKCAFFSSQCERYYRFTAELRGRPLAFRFSNKGMKNSWAGKLDAEPPAPISCSSTWAWPRGAPGE